MNNEKMMTQLEEEYRDYTNKQARTAMRDAAEIDYNNPSPVAAALLTLRTSPFHYWAQRRKKEIFEMEAKK